VVRGAIRFPYLGVVSPGPFRVAPLPRRSKGIIMPGGPKTKYIERFAEEAYELCAEGFTDIQLSRFFKVDKQTIYNWQKEHPELFDSIRRGKDEFNCKTAEQSLLKRIKGGTYIEITREMGFMEDGIEEYEEPAEGGKMVTRTRPKMVPGLVVTKKVKKKVLPDPKSIMYFLNNRSKKRWKNIKAVELSGPDGGPISTIEQARKQLLEEVDGATVGLPSNREEEGS
jgi:hypothetical protein